MWLSEWKQNDGILTIDWIELNHDSVKFVGVEGSEDLRELIRFYLHQAMKLAKALLQGPKTS